ncbi:MAG: class I SAM-dependent methyltransferase [Deltaproteobacteria bacterium]|nr:class I SAM-dependent methyltransferase [Deltaproteobacteria bacterium]MBW2444965.1 class I SAM-dependent methyltransferase [Deltaproteobacteria bacterium]
MSKSPMIRALYRARDLRSRSMFDAIRRFARGHVLDVGGWDFVETAVGQGVQFDAWTVLEPSDRSPGQNVDSRVHLVRSDGCRMGIADGSVDTVLCIQVLEHVFEPIEMVREISRVLRPGGHAVLLIPQTSTTHLAPDYHGNFSRYWIERVIEEAGLEGSEHQALGGVWSSMASHLVYFFLQSARFGGMSDARIRRPWSFYLLWPWMALFALVALPIALFFSLGDLEEEPNNHLVVVRKPG